jgi:hypothetical protein
MVSVVVVVVVKILSRISVGGISMVSVQWSIARWTFPHEQQAFLLFYLTRPKLALLKSLPCSDR